MQLYPPVALYKYPHLAFGETLVVADALAADNERELEATAEAERVLVRRVVERIEDESATESQQVPKAESQPVPQCPNQ